MTAVRSIRDILDRLGVPRGPSPVPTYRLGEGQRCTGCGLRTWIIRSATAECARCGDALPLASSPLNGACSAHEGA